LNEIVQNLQTTQHSSVATCKLQNEINKEEHTVNYNNVCIAVISTPVVCISLIIFDKLKYVKYMSHMYYSSCLVHMIITCMT